jgi:predicted metalloprotease with PDZ domain
MVDILSRACRVNLKRTLASWLDTASELPTARLLAGFGLALEAKKPSGDDTFGEKVPFQKAPVDWFTGLVAKEDGGALRVARVLADSPAERAGIGADDELLAIDGVRCAKLKEWNTLAKSARRGKSMRVLAASEGRVYEVTIEVRPSQKRAIVKRRQTKAQKRLFDLWLKR